MQYRKLGSSGLKVSPLCLGTMMFGGATDEPTAGKIIAVREGDPFASLDDVVGRKALSQSIVDKIRTLVTVTP